MKKIIGNVVKRNKLENYVHDIKFINYSWGTNRFPGGQIVFKFNNGYGASLIKHNGSYGGDQGLFEIAVLKFDQNEWDIDYKTRLTNDVLGYLNKSKVDQTLRNIQKL